MAEEARDHLVIEARVNDAITAELARIQGSVDKFAKATEDSFTKAGKGAAGATTRAIDDTARAAVAASKHVEKAIKGTESSLRTGANSIGSFFRSAVATLGSGADAGALIEAPLAAAASSAEGLAVAAGLSGTALLGVGAAASGVAAVGTGLAFATREAIALEKALIPTVVLLEGGASQLGHFKEQSRALAAATGIAAAEIGAGYAEAIASGVRGQQQIDEFVKTASAATLAGLGTIQQSVAALDGVLDAYGRSVKEKEQITGALFAAAKEGESAFAPFVSGVQRAGVVASALEIHLEDVAAVLATITKRGVSAEQAASGLTLLMTKLASATDPARQAIEGFGVDLSASALKAKGLSGALQEIGEKVPRNILVDLLGSPRIASAALAAIEDGGRGVLEVFAQMDRGVELLEQANVDRLNLSSERLARTWEAIKASTGGVGDDLLDGLASLISKPLETFAGIPGIPRSFLDALDLIGKSTGTSALPEPVTNEQLASYRTDIAAALRGGIEEGAVDGALILTRALGTAIADARERASALSDEIDAAKWENLAGGNIAIAPMERELASLQILAAADEVDVLNRAIQGLGIKTAFDEQAGQVRRLVAAIDDAHGKTKLIFQDLPVTIAPKLEPTKFEEDLRRALDNFKPQTLDVQLAPVVPKKVQDARDTLERFKGKPEATILGPDRKQVEAAMAVLARYDAALKESIDLGAMLGSRTTDGLARQREENLAAERAIQRKIASLSLEEIATGKLAAALAELTAVQRRREDDSVAKAVSNFDRETLALRVKISEETRTIALATGDIAKADQAGIGILNAKKALIDQQLEAQIAAATATARTDEIANGLLDDRIRALKDAALGEQAALDAAARRVEIERSRETENTLAGARTDILVGLDAELAKIEATRIARELAAEEAVRAGKLEADALGELLFLYDVVAARDKQRAEREAGFASQEQLARLVGETSQAYEVQAAVLLNLRSVEADRFEAELKANGARQDLIGTELFLFDLTTERLKKELALQEALKPTAAIVEQNQLAAAYAKTVEQLKAGAFATDEFTEALRENIAAARQGGDALRDGFAEGVRQAVDVLRNDFVLGVDTARTALLGLRDDAARAFVDIVGHGKKASEALKEVAVNALDTIAEGFAKKAFADIILSVLPKSETPKDTSQPKGIADIFRDALGQGDKPGDMLVTAGRDLSGAAAELLRAAGALGSPAAAGAPGTPGAAGQAGLPGSAGSAGAPGEPGSAGAPGLAAGVPPWIPGGPIPLESERFAGAVSEFDLAVARLLGTTPEAGSAGAAGLPGLPGEAGIPGSPATVTVGQPLAVGLPSPEDPGLFDPLVAASNDLVLAGDALLRAAEAFGVPGAAAPGGPGGSGPGTLANVPGIGPVQAVELDPIFAAAVGQFDVAISRFSALVPEAAGPIGPESGTQAQPLAVGLPSAFAEDPSFAAPLFAAGDRLGLAAEQLFGAAERLGAVPGSTTGIPTEGAGGPGGIGGPGGAAGQSGPVEVVSASAAGIPVAPAAAGLQPFTVEPDPLFTGAVGQFDAAVSRFAAALPAPSGDAGPLGPIPEPQVIPGAHAPQGLTDPLQGATSGDPFGPAIQGLTGASSTLSTSASSLSQSIMEEHAAAAALMRAASPLEQAGIDLQAASISVRDALARFAGEPGQPGLPVGPEGVGQDQGIGPEAAGITASSNVDPAVFSGFTVSVGAFQLAVDRFAASIPLAGSEAISPAIAGVQSQGSSTGNVEAGTEQGEAAGAALIDASAMAGSALSAAGNAAAGALIQGGSSAGDILLQAAIQAAAQQAASSIAGALGLGGVVSGHLVRPQQAASGGVYNRRTLLEVAEIPGLRELVAPLENGALPAHLERDAQGNVSASVRVKGAEVPVLFDGNGLGGGRRGGGSRSTGGRSSAAAGGGSRTLVLRPSIQINVSSPDPSRAGDVILKEVPRLMDAMASQIEHGRNRRFNDSVRGLVSR